MRSIFKNWSTISKKIESCRHLLLLSDFDGTLCKIADRPSGVKLSKKVKSSLKKLKSHPKITVGIVSGRPLKSIKEYIGLRQIFYVGNHGLQIDYVNLKGKSALYVLPEAKKTLALIKEIAHKLKQRLKSIKGVIVEDKKYTLSLHYRLVKDKEKHKVKAIFNNIIRPYKKKKKVKVTSGKKVYEVRPPIDWDKGKAVLKLKKKINAKINIKDLVTIYLGDDATDEDAFNVLSSKDIGIFIGSKRQSKADYKIESVSKVPQFLKQVYEIISK
jgi:trehalose-phosphatase